MPEPQLTRCYLYEIEAFGVSATGDPYADVTLIHPQTGPCQGQAFASCFGDLSQLTAFKGGEVNLQVTPTGLQLRPIAEQVISDLDGSIDMGRDHGQPEDRSDSSADSIFFPPETPFLESCSPSGTGKAPTVHEVAATVARLARDFELPTAMWIHLP